LKLPDKIRIFGIDYEVQYERFDEKVQLSNLSGSVMSCQQKIQINSGNARGQQEATLLHEIIHAIDYRLGFDFSEAVTQALSSGLYQVLNDNGFLKEK
jgi:hypothetical protein